MLPAPCELVWPPLPTALRRSLQTARRAMNERSALGCCTLIRVRWRRCGHHCSLCTTLLRSSAHCFFALFNQTKKALFEHHVCGQFLRSYHIGLTSQQNVASSIRSHCFYRLTTATHRETCPRSCNTRSARAGVWSAMEERKLEQTKRNIKRMSVAQ